MFLSRRATQAEYFDAERPTHELADFYAALKNVNDLCRFAQPFQRWLPQILGASACHSLSILDLGAGDGWLGRVLTEWAARRGWCWRVTDLDVNLQALRLNPANLRVAGSALALPFRNASFDLVIASQTTHHFAGAQAREHLQEAWRVARRAIFLSDLHRNAAFYGLLRLLFLLRRYPESFCRDGLLSVKRGWRIPELEALGAQAGIPGAQVRLYYGARILLHASKAMPADRFEC